MRNSGPLPSNYLLKIDYVEKILDFSSIERHMIGFQLSAK